VFSYKIQNSIFSIFSSIAVGVYRMNQDLSITTSKAMNCDVCLMFIYR